MSTCPECGYNAGERRILDHHMSITGHSFNPQTKPKPSGLISCSRHPELPPMTMVEFDGHRTSHEMADSMTKTYNVQRLGLFGMYRNTKIRSCEAVSIPEGDPRLKLVPSVPVTHGQTVVKEVVREVLVTCRYCGARASQGTLRCPSCGATL